MEYKIIDAETEKKKMLVDFLRAQENDHMTFTDNKARYEAMLTAGLPDGQLKTKIEYELPIINERIAEVEAIVAATRTQITDAEIAVILSE